MSFALSSCAISIGRFVSVKLISSISLCLLSLNYYLIDHPEGNLPITSVLTGFELSKKIAFFSMSTKVKKY